MPTYQYLCRNCEHRFDIVQSIHDEPLTVCPECAGTVRRVLHPVGVTFKGSGFYRTDSRSGSTPKSTKSEPSSTTSAASSASGGTGGSSATSTSAANTSSSDSAGSTKSAPAPSSSKSAT